MGNDKTKFLGGIVEVKGSSDHTDFKHVGLFFRATKRYTRIIGDKICESNDPDAKIEDWKECQQLPF